MGKAGGGHIHKCWFICWDSLVQIMQERIYSSSISAMHPILYLYDYAIRQVLALHDSAIHSPCPSVVARNVVRGGADENGKELRGEGEGVKK